MKLSLGSETHRMFIELRGRREDADANRYEVACGFERITANNRSAVSGRISPATQALLSGLILIVTLVFVSQFLNGQTVDNASLIADSEPFHIFSIK